MIWLDISISLMTSIYMNHIPRLVDNSVPSRVVTDAENLGKTKELGKDVLYPSWVEVTYTLKQPSKVFSLMSEDAVS